MFYTQFLTLPILVIISLHCIYLIVAATVSETGNLSLDARKLERYIVSIQRKSNKYNGHNHQCAGIILTADLVLTAAHCLFDATKNAPKHKHELQLVTGLSRLLQWQRHTQVYNITEFIVHEQYSHERGYNDIAIILVNKRIESVGEELVLPLQRAQPARKAVLLGWGTLLKRKIQADTALASEQTIVLEDLQCVHAFGTLFATGMLCAAFQRSCVADAGSPLIAANNLIGMVAFGIDCGAELNAGAFMDLHYYAKWIKTKQRQLQHKAKILRANTNLEPKQKYAKHVVSIEYAEQPYMLYGHICEGAILSKSCVLTAASCLLDSATNELVEVSNLLVIAGVTNRLVVTNTMQVLNVKSITLHKNYTQGQLLNDLAILKLKDILKEDDTHRQHIRVAHKPLQFEAAAIVLQWQKQTKLDHAPGNLTFVNVSIVHPSKCFNEDSEGLLCVHRRQTQHTNMCLNRKGSPLICNNTLLGILTLDFGCNQFENASIYTDAWYYRDWIEENAAFSRNSKLYLLFLFVCVFVY